MLHSFSSQRFPFLIDSQVCEEENTIERISDSSFMEMEKLCHNHGGQSEGNLLQDVHIPKFNDTLEEVDFILSLGLQLKAEGKTNFPTPLAPAGRRLSVQMDANAQSSPKTSLFASTVERKRLSNVISPIFARDSGSPFTTCRSNITQVI